MKILGIDFDPLNEPLSRRLEILVVGVTMFTFFFGAVISTFLTGYLILFTRFWWLMLIYVLWIYLDKETCEKGGRRLNWVQQWIWWRYGCSYFPISLDLVPGATFNAKKNYLLCYFPHGVLPLGSFACFLTNLKEYNKLFPDHQARLATLAFLFSVPFFRELALATGGISCSFKSLSYMLTRQGGGYLTILAVGGAAESYNSQPGIYKIKLKNRKGFVKLALKSGSPLVPVIAFGETDVYTQVTGPRLYKFQEFLRRFLGFAPLVFNGRGLLQNSFGMFPKRTKITVLVGKPMEFDRIQEPTNEKVDVLHKQFMLNLKNMFEGYKYKYLKDPYNTFLEIQ